MPIDMSLATAVKAPPRKRTASTSSRTPVAQPETQSLFEKRVSGLNGLAQLGQAGLLMFGQWADAATVGQHFPNIAVEAVKLAEHSETWAKPIDFLIELGPYAGLVAAGLPMVMQLMANHKMLNARMLIGQGVVPPELLESQMKAEVAQQMAAHMKAQQMAAEQAKKAQEEYERIVAESGANV